MEVTPDYLDFPTRPAGSADSNLARLPAITTFIGTSKKFLLALDQMRRFSDLNECVLIEGETGTGKELAAHQIHQKGKWKTGPFISINCAAIQSNMLQAELFGHEPGAFTDAKRARLGLIAQAEGGTLFLDEVNSLCMDSQGALLRFLNDQTYRRLGSDQLRQSHVRIVVATNRNLSEDVKKQLFREDLWYRLKKLTLPLPPLRERQDDIELLANFFGKKHTRSEPLLQPRNFDDKMLCWMEQYSWPGNVRELESVVYQWLAGESWDAIQSSCGWPEVTSSKQTEVGESDLKQGFRSAQMDWQRRYLMRLYRSTGGVISEAARIAQVDRNALRRLFRKHGVLSTSAPQLALMRGSSALIYPIRGDNKDVGAPPLRQIV
jgi:two-component system, NtrC family, response regulator GlrR